MRTLRTKRRRHLPAWMARGRAAGVAVVSVLAVAGCVPSPAPGPLEPAAEPTGLRVMTYNLLGAQADGNVYSEWAGWAARVQQLRPDVLVVQEAQGDDVAALYGSISADYTVATYIPWVCDAKGNPEGVAILVRSTVSLIGGGGTQVGSSCTDPTLRRVLAWADLALPTGPLRVYGTHLTAGGGLAAQSREAQMRAIRSIIAADDPNDARRWLLVGDLNVSPGSTGYRLITGTSTSEPSAVRYVDTFAEAHPNAADPAVCPAVGADPASMAELLADPAHVRDCGYTAGWPKDDNLIGCDVLSLCTSWEQRRDLSVTQRIDYVLRADDGPVSVASTFVPNRSDADFGAVGSEWFRLSDHLPYVVDLTIEGPVARAGS